MGRKQEFEKPWRFSVVLPEKWRLPLSRLAAEQTTSLGEMVRDAMQKTYGLQMPDQPVTDQYTSA